VLPSDAPAATRSSGSWYDKGAPDSDMSVFIVSYLG
jgi:hypothetical protein